MKKTIVTILLAIGIMAALTGCAFETEADKVKSH